MAGQQKQYRAGQKKPGGAGTVHSGTQQGDNAKNQEGKTYKVKNRTVNHNRSK